jgi:pyruvate,water dikinase
MMAPPQESIGLGSVSFVLVSDLYLNFSVKAGYHFSTIDAYCEPNPNKNYINFRFAGGGANRERRLRRLSSLGAILEGLNFTLHIQGDLLSARIEKLESGLVLDRLAQLGRLTMCSRQLDMLMDSDGTPALFAQAFLAGRFDIF